MKYSTWEERLSSAVDRIEQRLDRSGDCWLWPGGTARGYGQLNIRIGGTDEGCVHVYVHRVMYERYKGLIPEGLQIDHTCRVKNCANPDHLEVVTQKENVQRWAATITHCPQGHEYNEENTYYHASDRRTWRNCRVCSRERQQLLEEEK